ncbi:MAG: hypothetical protein F6K50_34340 [Moorea sp. SIO3I7]|nr:hypothetical protein [Moorena sp. SIO3I7]NEO65994.1 hypothetical protein [Moorena sp. SIO4G2]
MSSTGCDARALSRYGMKGSFRAYGIDRRSRYANAFYSNDVDRLFSTLTLTYSMLPNFRS